MKTMPRNTSLSRTLRKTVTYCVQIEGKYSKKDAAAIVGLILGMVVEHFPDPSYFAHHCPAFWKSQAYEGR